MFPIITTTVSITDFPASANLKGGAMLALCTYSPGAGTWHVPNNQGLTISTAEKFKLDYGLQ